MMVTIKMLKASRFLIYSEYLSNDYSGPCTILSSEDILMNQSYVLPASRYTISEQVAVVFSADKKNLATQCYFENQTHSHAKADFGKHILRVSVQVSNVSSVIGFGSSKVMIKMKKNDFGPHQRLGNQPYCKY